MSHVFQDGLGLVPCPPYTSFSSLNKPVAYCWVCRGRAGSISLCCRFCHSCCSGMAKDEVEVPGVILLCQFDNDPPLLTARIGEQCAQDLSSSSSDHLFSPFCSTQFKLERRDFPLHLRAPSLPNKCQSVVQHRQEKTRHGRGRGGTHLLQRGRAPCPFIRASSE